MRQSDLRLNEAYAVSNYHLNNPGARFARRGIFLGIRQVGLATNREGIQRRPVWMAQDIEVNPPIQQIAYPVLAFEINGREVYFVDGGHVVGLWEGYLASLTPVEEERFGSLTMGLEALERAGIAYKLVGHWDSLTVELAPANLGRVL